MAAYRSFTIAYGDKTIGINETRMDAEGGKLRVSETPETFSIDFNFVLIGTTAANLKAETDELHRKFKKIRQNVVITINGQTAWSFSHSDNTGFNSRATLSKTGGTKDGGLSRTFSCKIEVGLPFEDASLLGRRSSQVSVSTSSNRKITLNITGEYVCHSAAGDASEKKSALQNYYRAVDAYVTSVKSILTGVVEDYSPDGSESPPTLVFERISEDYSYDDQNKVLNFAVTEEELLYKQNKDNSTIDNPDIYNQTLSLMMSRQWPGDSRQGEAAGGAGNRYRVTKVTAQYNCLVKKNLDDQTGSPKDLEAVYFDTIRPFLLDEINNITEFQGTTGFICTVTEENVSYDKTALAISATILADLIISGTDGNGNTIIQKSLTITDDEKLGMYLVPVWATGAGGDYLSKYVFSGPGSHVRNVTVTYRVIGAKMAHVHAGNFIGNEANMEEITPAGNGWVTVDRHSNSTVLEIGTPETGGDADQYIVTDYTLVTVSERHTAPSSTGPTHTVSGFRGSSRPPVSGNQ